MHGIVGGAGFVGCNIADRLLADGRPVLLLDRAPPPPDLLEALDRLPGRLDFAAVDVTDPWSLADAMPARLDTLVLGAAVTAKPAREAADPESIMAVNLASLIPLVRAAKAAGVGRILNLSSAGVYGPAGYRLDALDEAGPAEPETLYGWTKLASEGVLARLGQLWGLDTASVRLSGVFGPYERDTGVRDTLSPQGQVVALARAGIEAVLPRACRRDWIYGADVAEAIRSLLLAPALNERLFNVSTPRMNSVLAWGEAIAARRPGFVCRVAEPGETPNVDVHAPRERAPLATARLAAETGWTARFDPDTAADDLCRRFPLA